MSIDVSFKRLPLFIQAQCGSLTQESIHLYCSQLIILICLTKKSVPMYKESFWKKKNPNKYYYNVIINKREKKSNIFFYYFCLLNESCRVNNR
jgi:hypothetical protein